MHITKRTFAVTVVLIVYSLIYACEPAGNHVKQNKQSSVSLQKYFYKRMEGTINGKWKVVMNLTRKDTALTGNYYYENVGKPVFFTFDSRIDSGYKINIGERTGRYDNNYNEIISGKFTGKFVSNKKIEGEWSKPGTNTKYKFSLQEKYPTGNKEFIMKRASREFGSRDSGGASIEYMFPQYEANNTESIDSINNKILNKLISGYEYGDREIKWKSFDQEMSDFINRFRSFQKSSVYPAEYKPFWENSFVTSVVFNSDGVLGLENIEFRFEGGAHPNTYFTFYNYNINTGQTFTLQDIFKNNYKANLDKIGEKLFREKYNIKPGKSFEKAGYFLKNNKFHLNSNFAIFKGGLLFKFNPYEIGPYSIGAPDVFIPYKDIKKLLKENSLISNFIK